MIINSRPLNMLHDEKMYEIITPNRLLFGQKLYQENRNWESNSDIAELETKRIQYVTSLQECQKSFKTKKQLFRAKDDIVLSYEEKQPRKKWLLGKLLTLPQFKTDKHVEQGYYLEGPETLLIDQ